MSKLDLWRTTDGSDGYILDGAYYEDATSLLHCGVLGFCGCGSPEANLNYIRIGLELIDEAFRDDDPEDNRSFTDKYHELQAKRLAHFGSEVAMYFFYYWACDPNEFTEHGGAVPGWLTDKGRELMEALQEWESTRPKEVDE